MRSTPTLLLALVAVLLTLPDALAAQESANIMRGIRDGGGWLNIPISQGRGSFSSVRVPTAGLTLNGCVTVWHGHSGSWEIEARENVADGRLDLSLEPGERARFSHQFGMQAQVDFDFRWSEPRDTTLLLWIGVDLDGDGGRDACEPTYR